MKWVSEWVWEWVSDKESYIEALLLKFRETIQKLIPSAKSHWKEMCLGFVCVHVWLLLDFISILAYRHSFTLLKIFHEMFKEMFYTVKIIYMHEKTSLSKNSELWEI